MKQYTRKKVLELLAELQALKFIDNQQLLIDAIKEGIPSLNSYEDYELEWKYFDAFNEQVKIVN